MKCCCPACMTNMGTRQFGDSCCKCIPKRICVTVYPPENRNSYCPCSDSPDDEPYGPIARMTLHLDCSERHGRYIGSFACGRTSTDQLIDLKFTFERLTFLDGTSGCFFILESAALEYLPHDYPSPDTRILLPLGGPYADPDVMRSECVNAGEFEFVVDLGTAFPGCGDAIIKVSAADFMEEPKPVVPLPKPCFCACVHLKLLYGGLETTIVACWDEFGGWQGVFSPNPSEDYHVKVYLDSPDGELPTILRLESDLGNGAAKNAICDCRPTMYAEWDLYESGAKISIVCDPYMGCADCKCFCRCVCIVYSDSRNAAVAHACWDEAYHWWEAVFELDDGDVAVKAQLICDPATGVTKMHLFTSLGDPLPSAISAITCPDVAASWQIAKYNGDTATISVVCDTCGACRNLVRIPCCPVPIPVILWVTVTGTTSCLGLALDPPVVTPCISTTFPIALNASIIPPNWNGMAKIACPAWQYLNTVYFVGEGVDEIWLYVETGCGIDMDLQHLRLMGRKPDGTFVASDLSWTTVPGGTCDPVMVEATGIFIPFMGDPACSDTRQATLSLTVTE